MVKEEKPIFLKTLLVLIFIAALEFGTIFYFHGLTSFSGLSIVDAEQAYENLNPNSKIFLIVQGIIFFPIIFIVLFKNGRIKKRKKERVGINIPALKKTSKTNLDALYSILQTRKQISIRSIAILFEIKEELAIEWAQILESGNLVILDYPGFGGPVVILKEKEQKTIPKKNMVEGNGKGNKNPKKEIQKNSRVAPKKKEKIIKKKLDKRTIVKKEKKKNIVKKRVKTKTRKLQKKKTRLKNS